MAGQHDEWRDDVLLVLGALEAEFSARHQRALNNMAAADNVWSKERYQGRADAWEAAACEVGAHHKAQSARMLRKKGGV